MFFTFGGLNTTKAIVDKFLCLGEVQRLLDDKWRKSRQELTDAKTATAMLEAADAEYHVLPLCTKHPCGHS